MAVEVCEEDKSNIGKTKCIKVPQLFAAMIETPNGFELTEANLADAATLKGVLQNAIENPVGTRIYKWPKFSRMEGKSEETKYVESPNGTRKARDGRYRFLHFIQAALCVHKAMFSHTTTAGRLIYVDLEGNWLLTKKSNGAYAGVSIDLLNAEKLKLSTGDDLTESPIYVSLANNLDIDENGYLFNFPSVYEELEPLTDVDVTATHVAANATVQTVTVLNACDGTPITGLVQADFKILKSSDGTAQVPTAFADNGDGTYTITKATSFVTGTIDLVIPSLLSLSSYESTGAAALSVA